jgi:hypothetical protein
MKYMCIASGISIRIKGFYDYSWNYGRRFWYSFTAVISYGFSKAVYSLLLRKDGASSTMLQETAARLNSLSNAASMVICSENIDF